MVKVGEHERLKNRHTISISAPSVAWRESSVLPASTFGAFQSAVKTNLTDSTRSGCGSVGWTFNGGHRVLDLVAAGKTLRTTESVILADVRDGTITQPVTLIVMGENHVPAVQEDFGDSVARAPPLSAILAVDASGLAVSPTQADALSAVSKAVGGLSRQHSLSMLQLSANQLDAGRGAAHIRGLRL